MTDILTGTPPELTYLHPFIQQAWMVVWAITSGALVVILGWMGLSFIVQEHLGRHQSGWREMVPRLVLGLTAAASSLWWCALVIDVAHAVSQFIAVIPGGHPRRPAAGAPGAAADRRGDRQHRVGGVHRAALPGLRILRPLPAGADDPAPGVHRHPALPGPHRLGAVDSAPHRRLGEALAAFVHDHGVPAGGAAHRRGPGLRLPGGLRGHRRLSSPRRTWCGSC